MPPWARWGARAVVLAALTLAFMLVSSDAWSYMRSTGGGTGSGSTATLASPTLVSASTATGGSTVTVTWNPPAAGLDPSGYRVQRIVTATGSAADACSTSPTVTTPTTSCTDSGIADGSYRYVIIAVLGSWTAPSASSPTVTVQSPVATTTTLASAANPAAVGQPVTYTATVAATTGTPTGTVTFQDGGQATPCAGGTPTLNAGSATCTVTYAASGSHQISAQFSGSTPYTSSTSTTLTQQVVKRAQSITISSTAPSAARVGDAGYAMAATASSGLPVALTSNTTTVCSITGSTISYVSAGTCTVRADQSGDATWSPAAQILQSFTVAKGAQTITFTSTPPASAMINGPAYTVSATVSSGLMITFTSSTTTVCTVSGSNVSLLGAGTCTVAANQAGNASYDPAPQATQSFTVAKASQAVTFTSTAPSAAMIGDAGYTVAATSTSALPVTFTSATPAICATTASTVTYLSAGTCTVQANQAGNATYAPAPQVTQSFLITAVPTTPTGLAVTATAGNATATWATVNGYTYECQDANGKGLPNASNWVTCGSPYTFTVKSGNHTFYVRAARGAVKSTPASQSF